MIPGQGVLPEHKKSSQHDEQHKAGMQYDKKVSKKIINQPLPLLRIDQTDISYWHS